MVRGQFCANENEEQFFLSTYQRLHSKKLCGSRETVEKFYLILFGQNSAKVTEVQQACLRGGDT